MVLQEVYVSAKLESYLGRCIELELELIQTHMTQKAVLRVEVGACRFAQQTSTAKI